MKADIYFANVEFFGAATAQRIRVRNGETFRIQLIEAGSQPTVWATTNDRCLSVEEGMTINAITVSALEVGNSEIQVQVNRQVMMYLSIEVYSTEAANLGLSVGVPEPK